MDDPAGSSDQTSGHGRSDALRPIRGDDAAAVPQTGRIAMAGTFEVFLDDESNFRFRLKAPDGTVMAVSAAFDTKSAAVAGIAAVREYAGMGLIADLCPAGMLQKPVAAAAPGAVPQAKDGRRKPAEDFHIRARALRRAATAPRWAGAA
ncbi:DUF1508 domain-containing protein [Arthrobacter sp. UYCu712]|uniref:YegP family protein n=1 Tax=Arthrobacter sp. UYCu712 TaxID=3156340 RepID=UPI003395F9ED